MFIYNMFAILVVLVAAGTNSVQPHRQTHWSYSPFKLPQSNTFEKNPIKRVAIIGAGAGGSSAAYFLNDYIKRTPGSPQIEIEVFEKSDRIGGRAMSKFFGEDHEKYELGANAFVAENYNLMNASRDFGIEKETNQLGNSTFGLYNGNEFVALYDSSWSNQAAFYYRYGWGAFRANRFANAVKAQFLKSYDESVPPYQSVEEMLTRVDLLQYVFKSTRDVLVNEWSAGPVYTDELFQAISRNIYASSSSLHSLAGAISLIAAQGSYTSVNGNDLFFSKYLEHSGASVHLNSSVTKITRVPGDYNDLIWNKYKLEAGGNEVDGIFDAVIMATPFHQSNIKVKNLEVTFEEVPYSTVYVAIIEDVLIDPAFFNLKDAAEIPNVIYGYNTSEVYTVIENSAETRRVSIEAAKPLTIEWLSSLFTTAIIPSQVTFKTWKAYPVMNAKDSSKENVFPPIILGPSLYYVNSVEPAISCMEVEVMSARNIARLVSADI